METESGVVQLQVKKCQEETRKDSPYKSLEKQGPADTWVSDFSLQNGEPVHFCCFKRPCLRYFVIAALGN